MIKTRICPACGKETAGVKECFECGAMVALNIGDARPETEYPAIAKKVEDLIASGKTTASRLERWCKGGPCACMGCANQWLSWAEYECYRKYKPEFNETGHHDARRDFLQNAREAGVVGPTKFL